ncbi:MAG TPA: sulfatase-like hydrolase/transferase [Clostridiales bacterium]|nr:sulfatase-like hydrolase/transferase [Clostridiales bacterium]
MGRKPHIIIFNPDEMRGDTLGHLGNPAAITPNLDRFASEEAVSFSNAYCQNPVCVPSRCSFFTGLYPHVRGHRTMGYLLQPGEDSLLKELHDGGYYVWMNDRNDLTAGQIPGWTEAHADEIYYGGQAKLGPGPEQPNLRGNPGSKYYYSHFEGRLKLDEAGKHYNGDDEIVDAAIDRILHPADDRPLCLFLGLMYPHTPYGVEEPYYSAIDRDKLPPRVRPEECSGKAKILDEIRKYQGMDQFSEEDWDELRAVYLGMCMKLDEQFGRMLQALKDAGIYDDCAIFFLSDHGDFTGDYGLVEKAQNSFEECLTKVPLLIKPPKNEKTDPGITSSLAELVDFYATVMDYAGIKPSHTHFGKSLREVIADRRKPGKEYVFCEGGRQPGETHCDEYHNNDGSTVSEKIVYWPKMKAQSDDEAHAKGIMIRSTDYKYISRTLGQDELYDLQKDPQERSNEINNPAYHAVVLKMQKDLLKWLQATSDIVPFEQDQRFTPAMTWARVKSLVPPEKEEEVKKMIENKVSFIELIQYCRAIKHN